MNENSVDGGTFRPPALGQSTEPVETTNEITETPASEVYSRETQAEIAELTNRPGELKSALARKTPFLISAGSHPGMYLAALASVFPTRISDMPLLVT